MLSVVVLTVSKRQMDMSFKRYLISASLLGKSHGNRKRGQFRWIYGRVTIDVSSKLTAL